MWPRLWVLSVASLSLSWPRRSCEPTYEMFCEGVNCTKCFKIVDLARINVIGAMSVYPAGVCRRDGTLRSAAEEDFVRDLATRTIPEPEGVKMWIGLQRMNFDNFIHDESLHDDVDAWRRPELWMWKHGARVETSHGYTNWALDQPDNFVFRWGSCRRLHGRWAAVENSVVVEFRQSPERSAWHDYHALPHLCGLEPIRYILCEDDVIT